MKIHDLINNQKTFFNTDKTKNIAFRKQALIHLKKAIEKHEEDISDALFKDLGKCKEESYLTEISIVLHEIDYAIKHLNKWAKPEKVKSPISLFPSKSFIYKEPYGVVLVLSPWNYPFQLCIAPVVGAIAAGNCVMIKPSKSSENTSNVMKEMLDEAFPQEYVCCLDSSSHSYEEILAEKYDYIMFTGSERVGKIVMAAASNNLTPVSLELGGKSPCIVDSSCDVAISAKRIAWGKFLNAGQTCVAPDYILVQRSIKEQFIKELQKSITQMYGEDICNNNSYPQIINHHHFERLCRYIDKEQNKIGGTVNEQSLKIAPTIFVNASFNDEIMQEEIFGPIFPVIAYDTIDEVINCLKSRPKPLALYLFTKDKSVIDKVICSISYGGGCVNDVVMHLANHHVPFGGVGNSGMGGYHGKYSFDTFTHKKSVIKNSFAIDVPLRYQPFGEKTLKKIKKIV